MRQHLRVLRAVLVTNFMNYDVEGKFPTVMFRCKHLFTIDLIVGEINYGHEQFTDTPQGQACNAIRNILSVVSGVNLPIPKPALKCFLLNV